MSRRACNSPLTVVIGGAGYIGRALLRVLPRSVVVDDKNSLPPDLSSKHMLIRAQASRCRDRAALDGKVLYYLAGEISVQESMQQPQFYWERNVVEMARILYGQNPRWIYFSSSAAVYQPIRGRLKETDLLGPVSVYGMTKLVSEQYLQNCYPKKSTIFRFFNASGGQENHDPETHFIPRMIQSSFLGKQLEIYGDGEQVRDFVHVDDIADAHKLAEGIPGIFNLGSGVGYPINEVVRRYKALTGKPLRIVYRKERKGDPKHLVADITRAETVLGWRPKYTLDNILWSAYKAYEDMNAWRKDETFSSCG